MAYKRHFKPKIGKLTFTDVAKASGVKGLSLTRNKNKAFKALRDAGYGERDAKSIVSGTKKMEQASLKKVFQKLREGEVIAKGSTAVTDYIEREKNKQRRIVGAHLRERADEIYKEREAEKAITQKQAQGKNKTGQAVALASAQTKKEAKAKSASKITEEPPSFKKGAQFDQTPFVVPQTNIKKAESEPAANNQSQNNNQSPKTEEPDDMVID
ncbi:hypothetical protein KJ840_01100 [Patescibacteria group bacterium]|nr:hypothetical protein [Patescibacteria group bacterium]